MNRDEEPADDGYASPFALKHCNEWTRSNGHSMLMPPVQAPHTMPPVSHIALSCQLRAHYYLQLSMRTKAR